jgi:outer membrane protein assembly factor BamB
VQSTTTTLDPFAETVLDACGNDLSALTSTVWAVDPADGAVQWKTEVPLASNFLLRSSDGDPQLSLVNRAVEVVLDDATGSIVDTPPAGAHEVLVDVAGATETGVGGMFVDGEKQPAEISVDGRRLTTAAGETGQTTVGLTAFEPGSAVTAWRVDLGPADQVGSLSAPVLYGDTVVVVSSPPRPACP